MEITTLAVAWAMVTTVVAVLAYARAAYGIHDILDIHLSKADVQGLDAQDVRRGRRMQIIDWIGIPLTVVSVLMALGILFLWATQSAGGR